MPWGRPSEAAAEPGRPAHRSAPEAAEAAEAVPRTAVRPLPRPVPAVAVVHRVAGGGGGGTGAAIRLDRCRGWRRCIGSTGGGGGGTGAAIASTVPGVAAVPSGLPAAVAEERVRPSRRTAPAGEVAAEQRGWAAEAAAGCSGWRSHRRRRCGGWARRADRRMTARRPCPGRRARARRRRSVLPWRPGMPTARTRHRRCRSRCSARTESAVVSVAGVDGPVAAGFALGDLIPFTVGGRVGLPGECEASGADDGTSEGDLRDVYGRCSGLAMPSTHRCVGSSLRRPRGQLSGSGWRGCPAGGVETMPASPQGAEISSRSFYFGGPVGPPPPSKVVRC